MSQSLKDKIFHLIEKNPLGIFATITEDGKPWARFVSCSPDKDLCIRFATFRNSRKVAQIKKNPEVHITLGDMESETMGSYVQIQGRAEVADSEKIRHAFWTDALKGYFKSPDDPNFVVVIVKTYRVEWEDESHQKKVWEP